MSNVPPVIGEYYKVGGIVGLDSRSYVTRPADDQLLNRVQAGDFCYVLTCRQMGKSSLMLRTAKALSAQGIHSAIVDLSALGTQITSAQWYLGILTRLKAELGLFVDLDEWWEQQGALGVVQRFGDFIDEVILSELDERVVIFFDEIDSTLGLDFTDDFFALIRVMYNRRASNPAYDRLTFVLLGVATPTDLIKDLRRTPFNIGHAINLDEFDRNEMQPLEIGLKARFPDAGARILDRIYYWTGGHPYLTQKICRTLVESDAPLNAPDVVDVVDVYVEKLFLNRNITEENLRFVRSSIEASPDRRQLLRLYRRVYDDTVVSDDDRSPLHNRLKLIGLAASCDGILQVRNRIYRRVFNKRWIKRSTPTNWAMIIIAASMFVIVVAVSSFAFSRFYADSKTININRTDFVDGARHPEPRLVALDNICQVRPRAAHDLFFDLDPQQQIELFQTVNVKAIKRRLPEVIKCIGPEVDSRAPEHAPRLHEAICDAKMKLCHQDGKRDNPDAKPACECKSTVDNSHD